MVVVYDNGFGSRVFAKIWSMFGGMCVHTSTGMTYTFKAEGHDRRLWLYFGGKRSEDGFQWRDGVWTGVAELRGGVIRVLPEGEKLGHIESGDFIINAYTHSLLLDSVLDQFELGATPPNPFRIW
jgi:hypothetical protein